MGTEAMRAFAPWALGIMAGILIPMTAMAAPNTAMCHASTGPLRGTLVELYTSEGCSSCPPADRLFAQVAANADPVRLSLLAFHVDYWDSSGWPDRFGSAAWSARQRDRVSRAGSASVYTPQVMVGQRVGFPWGSSAAMAELQKASRQASPLSIGMTARRAGTGLDLELKVASQAGGALPAGNLYLALYENGLSTHVKAGENQGVLLRHERVVRQLLGPFPLSATGWSRTLHVSVPGDADADKLGLTAFVQSRPGDTLQAVRLPLGDCAR
jgi:hypothetical protein